MAIFMGKTLIAQRNNVLPLIYLYACISITILRLPITIGNMIFQVRASHLGMYSAF